MRGFNGTLLVCSESTKDFMDGFDKVRVVKGAPDVSILDEVGVYEKVTAIGGGAVIDTAKILAKNPIVSYPTTAAGSTETSWSVYWDGKKKCSIKRHKPRDVIINSEFLNIPYTVKAETTFDVVSHCLDSLNSKKATKESIDYCNRALKILRNAGEGNVDLIRAGREAGKAIEIAGTNLLHSLSYPLTGYYNMSHGLSLGYFLPKISKFMLASGYSNYTSDTFYDVDDIIDPFVNFTIDFEIDLEMVVDEALKYNKIYESEIFIDRKILLEVLK